MKKGILFILLYALILLAVLVSGSGFILTNQFPEAGYDFTDFLKYMFLYSDPNLPRQFSSSHIMLYFSVILFAVYILILHSFDSNRKYRSLLILRYGSKLRYYRHNLWGIWVKSIRMTVFIAASLLLCAAVFSIRISTATYAIKQMLLFCLNMQLFYFVIGLLNFFCTLRFKESVSILACLSFSSLLLTFDAYQPHFSLIVFGDLPKLLIGCVSLSALAVLSLVGMLIAVKRADLL